MTKKGIDKRILALITSAHHPVSTRDISERLGIAWHTADRYCLKLQLKQAVDSFTIGKATAWYKK
ncbi:MAG TPA: FaeA/PapI family transcriptional regulator [Candidatus Nanoarchaeia archaeon]|nr:FaeA/PapI family transcriptional regulator [Candidatus Nanoarchaeia archaeon]